MVAAVCTNREPDAIAACVAALAAQAPAGALLLVTSGLDAAAVDSHRRSFPGAVETDPRPGLSLARNAALRHARARGARVLAFVDDDAVVEPGWWAALERHWRAAEPAVACIGGPIRPRYLVSPPPWLSGGIAHTLTLVDRGPAARDLDPSVEAVYGANISFSVEALDAVGGFAADLGHAGARVFFGEEDAVERELHRRGRVIRYVPDAAVEHLIGPERLTRRSFLRRRFAYGRALALRGERPARSAALATLRSGAGALAAAARGRQALAMERAVRAAENAGVAQASIRPRRIA